jgi:hypothetical protein
MHVVNEAGGIPQGSPPHQAGEDRGTVREGGTRRDGGTEPPAEEAGSHEETARRVQADEGRGQEVHQPTPKQP